MSNNKQFPRINEEKLFEVLYANNLAWEPQRRPEMTILDGEVVEVPGSYSIFKGNTDLKFQGVSDDYHILPNSQFVELSLQVANHFGLKDMPTFKQYSRKYNKQEIAGGVVRAIIPLTKFRPHAKNVGDVVDINIILTNSHDGSHGLQWGLYTKVLSCSNGMTYTKGMYKKSVRHLGNMRVVLEDSVKAFGQLADLAKNVESDITKLTNTGITVNDIQKVIQQVAGVSEKEKRAGKISTRKANIIEKFANVIKSELEEKGATQWGLYNAATYWGTHGNFSDLSKDVGQVAKTSNEVYNTLLKTSPGGKVLQDQKVPILIDQFQMSLQN